MSDLVSDTYVASSCIQHSGCTESSVATVYSAAGNRGACMCTKNFLWEICLLNRLVQQYVEERLEIFPHVRLRPKHHYLLHYPWLIQQYSPLIRDAIFHPPLFVWKPYRMWSVKTLMSAVVICCTKSSSRHSRWSVSKDCLHDGDSSVS